MTSDDLKLHWFLPTYGDSRFIVGGGHGLPRGVAGGDRPATIGYLSSICRAAESFGFTGALTPAGAWCEDAWLTTAMLARESEKLAFLIAFRPGLIRPRRWPHRWPRRSPRTRRGRLLLNVVTGGEAHEQRSYGDHLSKDERYARCDEFLSVVRRLWAGETVTHKGEHLDIDAATLPTLPDPVPPLYFGGSSPAAGPVAAEHADVYLTWGEPVDAVAKKIGWIRGLAAERGRSMTFGIRLHVITRDTADEAWAQAGRLVDALGEDVVSAAQAGPRAQRVDRSAAHAGPAREVAGVKGDWRDPHSLEVAPNLWAGVRARPWRRGHGARRQPTPRSPTGWPSTRPPASTSSCCPATRTSRSCTGSARASSRSSPSAVCSPLRPRREPATPRSCRRWRVRHERCGGDGRRRQSQAAFPDVRGGGDGGAAPDRSRAGPRLRPRRVRVVPAGLDVGGGGGRGRGR